METICMHCRKLRSPRGRWVAFPEEKIEALRSAGKLTLGCCFACTREHFGLNPDRRPEPRMEY
jgi:hypothetical protein